MRPLNVRAERHSPRLRTGRGRSTSVRHPGLLTIAVQAVLGGGWGYHQARYWRHDWLAPCGDIKHATEQLDDVLKHRIFPSAWAGSRPQ
ncbi:hypothetical protein [Spirillospora sp. CA-128828]|uniref:hypothetical protein n=1 Tax=Spirillospora sp. CA-128828 TaxID=3240033 RepID=UPI003D8A9758